jgi:hypothetical protein
MGGSAEQGNARINGSICSGGSGSSIIEVQLVGENFNPFDKNDTIYTTITDSTGNYEFHDIPFGNYYLYAINDSNSYAYLSGLLTVTKDELTSQSASLRKVGVITIICNPETSGEYTRFYIKGTSKTESIRNDAHHTIQLVNVPAGIHDVMALDSTVASNRANIFTAFVDILPDDSITISKNNRPPRIQYASTQLPSHIYTNTPVALIFNASDPDSDKVAYHLLTDLQVASLDSSTGVFSWIPNSMEASLTRIWVKVSDLQGAFSIFDWNFKVTQSGPTPIPEVTAGSLITFVDSSVIVTATIFDCFSSTPEFRFSWGDGDTTAWMKRPTAVHTWTRAGIFYVNIQAQCNDYASPSLWSEGIILTVNKVESTQIPSFVKIADTISEHDTVLFIQDEFGTGITVFDTLYDTIVIEVQPVSCGVNPLYQFYRDDIPISNWTSQTSITYLPMSTGIYTFQSRAWCDSSGTKPSEMSLPYTVTVNQPLPAPVFDTDSIYKNGLKTIDMKIPVAIKDIPDSLNVLYRIIVYNDIADDIGNDSINIGSVKTYRTCMEDENCIDTVLIYLNKPTLWITGPTLYLEINNPSGTYTFYLQAHIDGRPDSRWSRFYMREK